MKVGKEILKCIVLCCKQTVKYVCINQGGKMINMIVCTRYFFIHKSFNTQWVEVCKKLL